MYAVTLRFINLMMVMSAFDQVRTVSTQKIEIRRFLYLF